MNLDPYTLLWALTLGAVPATVWLLFWLHEDKKRPEPNHVIISCFLLGGVAVFLSIGLERFSLLYIGQNIYVLIFIWACIEEILKYLGARLGGLRRQWYNEPIDAIIYTLTVALGFAAFENTLYIIQSIGHEGVLGSILISNFRFVGASMLHFLSSLVLGSCIALGFYKNRVTRILYTICGLLTAIVLHSGFNLLIIKGALRHTIISFVLVWLCIIVFIALIEKIKKHTPRSEDITP